MENHTLRIETLIDHHTDESIERISEKFKKSEILDSLKKGAWKYSSSQHELKQLKAQLTKEGQEHKQATHIIGAYLGYDMQAKNYGGEIKSLKDLDLITLIMELIRVSDSSKIEKKEVLKDD